MALTLTISAILAVIAGLIILAFPKLTRLVLGLYLIAFGVARIMGY